MRSSFSKSSLNEIIAPEILDTIFSCLQDDPRTLFSCAVTCRIWLASCRPYLFQSVTLKNGDQCQRLVSVLRSSPIIQRHVRSLQVIQCFQDPMDPLYHPWVSADFAPSLPPLLPQVESLHFEGVDEVWTIRSLYNLSDFSTVANLSLYRFASSIPELCAFISAFPRLKNCIIRSFRDLGSGGLSSDNCWHFPGPRLKCLHIKSYNFPLTSEIPNERGFLEWILGTESKDTLRDVALTAQTSDVEAIGYLLRAVGPQLEHLEIICQGLGSSREMEDDESML